MKSYSGLLSCKGLPARLINSLLSTPDPLTASIMPRKLAWSRNRHHTQDDRVLKLKHYLWRHRCIPSANPTCTKLAHHSCSSGEGISPADSLEEPSTRPCHQLLSSLLMIWITSPVTNFSPASLQGIRLSFLGS